MYTSPDLISTGGDRLVTSESERLLLRLIAELSPSHNHRRMESSSDVDEIDALENTHNCIGCQREQPVNIVSENSPDADECETYHCSLKNLSKNGYLEHLRLLCLSVHFFSLRSFSDDFIISVRSDITDCRGYLSNSQVLFIK